MFEPITNENRASFEALMIKYYREGEDADTPIETIKDFIDSLYQMIGSGCIDGAMVNHDGQYEGFCLWMKDDPQSAFSEIPGYGTILEIGVRPQFRKKGLGREIVRYAEMQMRETGVESFYVSAYGPAETFWESCGYQKTERVAQNGLPVFVK